MGQVVHRTATQESEKIEKTTKQKVARISRRHRKEGGNHLG